MADTENGQSEDVTLEVDAGASKKAELDTDEISSAPVPKEAQKVELDLEDAPFLEEEEEEEEAEAPPVVEEAQEAEEPAWYRKRKFYIPAGIILALLISVVVYIMGKEEAPLLEKEKPLETTTLTTEEAGVPEEPAEPEKVEITVPLKPFWVEQIDEQGKVRFLVAKFSAVAGSEELSFELKQKNTVMRDAVFYYLKNKDLTYLSDKKNVEALKKDVLSVMNQYLSTGRVETLLIEEYLVK
jgi:flagellar FliL protein